MNRENQANSSKRLNHLIRVVLGLTVALFCISGLPLRLRLPYGVIGIISPDYTASRQAPGTEKIIARNSNPKGQSSSEPINFGINRGTVRANNKLRQASFLSDSSLELSDHPLTPSSADSDANLLKSDSGRTLSPALTLQSPAYNDTALVESIAGSLGTKTPVILIHGIHGNQSSPCNDTVSSPNSSYFSNLKLYLGINPDYNTRFKTYTFHYVSNKYRLVDIAQALRDRIQVFGNKQIVIIAHSMGGLVARHYMEMGDNGYATKKAGDRVIKLITLATPHHGSYGANGDARAGRFGDTTKWAALKLFDIGDELFWKDIGCCEECVSNLQQPNRKSLLWDNFPSNSNEFNWDSNKDYTDNPNEKNVDLPRSSAYNNKIIAYWGEIATISDLKLKAAATTLQKIKEARLDQKKFPENDGVVPVESAKFETPKRESWSLGEQVHCGGYNHREFAEGTEKKKCDKYGIRTKTLFASILGDILNIGSGLTPFQPAIAFARSSVDAGTKTYGNAVSLTSRIKSSKAVVEGDDDSEIELGNAGNNALQVTSLSIIGNNPNQFSILNAPATPFTIPAKSSVDILVRFNPTSTGSKSAILQASNNSSNPVVQVKLSGFGIPASCDITFSPESRYMPFQGGSGSFTIPNISCPWTISSNRIWIHPVAVGNTVNFTVVRNASSATRGGLINVSVYGRIYSFSIQQASSSSGCVLSLSTDNHSFTSNGGGGSFNVITPDTCGWGFQSGSPWITVNNQGLRQGSGPVTFNVASNTSSSMRFGTIIVTGQNTTRIFTVSQDAGSPVCTYSLSASEQNIPASGGQNSFSITTGAGCPWQISTPDHWISFMPPNNGTGSRTITYTVAENGSSSFRLGDISIRGAVPTPLLLTVNQVGVVFPSPSISLPITNFQMGDALINTTIYQSVLINNTGPGYLFLGSIYRSAGSADFDVSSYWQNHIIAPGASTSITIRLTPSSTGTRNAIFSISSNDPNNPTASFSISGNGVTQITGGIDFVWANKFTIPSQAFITNVASATINNNIYVFGGNDYKYDPTINSWSQIASRSFGQYGAADVVNGKAYLVAYDPFSISTKVQVYDPANNSWNTGATMPALRLDLAVAAANGKIYAFGGRNGSDGNAQTTSSVYEYNPSTNTWAAKANMLTARMGAVAITLNGLIYVIGGRGTNQELNTVEVYNPANNTWATRETMPSPRSWASAFILNNKIFVAGGNGQYLGQGSGNTRYDIVEEFDPSKPDAPAPGTRNAWSLRNPLLIGRYTCAAGAVSNKAYVIGGSNSSGAVYTIEEGTLSASPRFNMPVKSFDFGSMSVGSIGEKGIELQNVGNALLTINSISRISGSTDFTIYRYPSNMNGGESQHFRMRFTPSGTGTKTATYRITTNDTNAATVDFTVTGSGQALSSSVGNWQLVRSFSLQDTRNSGDIKIKNGKAYVTRFTNSNDIGLDVIDANTGNRLVNIPINGFQFAYPQPFLEVYGNQAYVAMRNLGSQDKLAVINLDNNTVTTSPVPYEKV